VDRFRQASPMLPVYILAGGRSSRFGSDKARATVNNIPLVVRLHKIISAQVSSQVFVVANAVDAYSDLGLTTLGDAIPELGPVSGIATALEHAHKLITLASDQNASETKPQSSQVVVPSQWSLIVSCDLLEWHDAWLLRLAEELAKEKPISSSPHAKAVCFYADAETSKKLPSFRWNPFPGLYHAAALPVARMICNSSRASMQSFLSDSAMNTIPASSIDLQTIHSANTKDELVVWQETHSKEESD